MAPARRPLIIGIGHPDRGDDGVGRRVAERLAGRVSAATLLLDGEATELIDRFTTTSHAIVVDAAVSGAAPGTVHRFDAVTEILPAGAFDVSTHGFGLAAGIELARALGQLPERCTVYAIEADRFDHGTALSPAVLAATEKVVGQIRAELAESGSAAGDDATAAES